MIPVEEAKGKKKGFLDEKRKEEYYPLFTSQEVPRAEKIANALEGLSIAEAQKLLEKINNYLLQTIFE